LVEKTDSKIVSKVTDLYDVVSGMLLHLVYEMKLIKNVLLMMSMFAGVKFCQERERRRLDMLMAKALEARKKEEVIKVD